MIKTVLIIKHFPYGRLNQGTPISQWFLSDLRTRHWPANFISIICTRGKKRNEENVNKREKAALPLLLALIDDRLASYSWMYQDKTDTKKFHSSISFVSPLCLDCSFYFLLPSNSIHWIALFCPATFSFYPPLFFFSTYWLGSWPLQIIGHEICDLYSGEITATFLGCWHWVLPRRECSGMDCSHQIDMTCGFRSPLCIWFLSSVHMRSAEKIIEWGA